MNSNLFFHDSRKTNAYDIALRSGIGQRESQQDTAYVAATDEEIFSVLCDGMGGAAGGELASFTAVKEFISYFQQHHTEPTWMRFAVETIDDIIFSLRNEHGQRLGAGTTLVSAYLSDNCLNWVSVGDSRLYIFRGNSMLQITQDHTYWFHLNAQREKNLLSPSAYQQEAKQGDALISYLGMGGLVLIDVNEKPVPLYSGDTLLLCSDGVYRSLSNEAIHRAITGSFSADEAADQIAQALRAYASCHHDQDNFTYILIRKT